MANRIFPQLDAQQQHTVLNREFSSYATGGDLSLVVEVGERVFQEALALLPACAAQPGRETLQLNNVQQLRGLALVKAVVKKSSESLVRSATDSLKNQNLSAKKPIIRQIAGKMALVPGFERLVGDERSCSNPIATNTKGFWDIALTVQNGADKVSVDLEYAVEQPVKVEPNTPQFTLEDLPSIFKSLGGKEQKQIVAQANSAACHVVKTEKGYTIEASHYAYNKAQGTYHRRGRYKNGKTFLILLDSGEIEIDSFCDHATGDSATYRIRASKEKKNKQVTLN